MYVVSNLYPQTKFVAIILFLLVFKGDFLSDYGFSSSKASSLPFPTFTPSS